MYLGDGMNTAFGSVSHQLMFALKQSSYEDGQQQTLKDNEAVLYSAPAFGLDSVHRCCETRDVVGRSKTNTG